MKQDHSPEWVCPLCEDASLDSIEHTREHIRGLHEEEMNNFGLSSVVSWCAVWTYGITLCPLCSSEGQQDAPELVDHVLSHAYDFALRSLPWTQDAVENTSRSIGTYNLPKDLETAYRLTKWVRKQTKILVGDGAMVRHEISEYDIQDCSNQSEQFDTEDYFAQHGYFEQSSMDDCSRGKAARTSGSPSLSHWTNKTSLEQESSIGNDDSSESSTTSDELVDSLLRKLVRSSFDAGKDFWPRGCIEEIITPEAVTKELQSRDTSQMTLSAIVDFIVQESKVTFAIALCSSLTGDKLLRAMIQFKDLGFNDCSLPVDDDDEHVFYPPTEKGYRSPWSRITVQNFRLYQWYSIAPVFDNTNRIINLPRKTIFPFTWVNLHGSSGTFGEVRNIVIHPEHRMNGIPVRPFSFPSDPVFIARVDIFLVDVRKEHVAVKQLHRSYSDDVHEQQKLDARWDNEVTANKTFSSLKHPNIIQFITAIIRDRKRYLMFEWADGGSLREFWTQPPRLTRTFVEDVVAQLRGLAHALENIHSLNYLHGDISPDNIVRVTMRAEKDSPQLGIGTLKICGMSLSRPLKMETRLNDVEPSER